MHGGTLRKRLRSRVRPVRGRGTGDRRARRAAHVRAAERQGGNGDPVYEDQKMGRGRDPRGTAVI